MTLVEVIIALTLILVFGVSSIQLANHHSRLSMQNALRSEAHRLLQDQLDALMAVPFDDFAASPEETIQSRVWTSHRAQRVPSLAPSGVPLRPVEFRREVEAVVMQPNLRTLRVSVFWQWQGRDFSIANYTITRTRES